MYFNQRSFLSIEGFHVTSQQPNRASHASHSRHVGSFFALSGIGKSHKICPHSLLLNLHKAKLHRSNNVINIYSLTASLTCSNKISKKLKHILLFFRVFPIPRHAKNIQHGVGTKCAPGAYRVVKTLYTPIAFDERVTFLASTRRVTALCVCICCIVCVCDCVMVKREPTRK